VVSGISLLESFNTGSHSRYRSAGICVAPAATTAVGLCTSQFSSGRGLYPGSARYRRAVRRDASWKDATTRERTQLGWDQATTPTHSTFTTPVRGSTKMRLESRN